MATSYPPNITGYEEGTAGYTALYNQGVAAAQSIGDNQGAIWIVFDFGRPAYSGGDFGTILFGGGFTKNATLATAVEGFADGWHHVSPHQTSPTLAISTSNMCMNSGDPGCSGFTKIVSSCGSGHCAGDFGDRWAYWTSQIDGYQRFYGYTAQNAGGGFDLEPGYNPGYNSSTEMAGGFNSSSSNGGNGSVYGYADFGSAESTWSRSQVYHVSYGLRAALPFPEIYSVNPSGMKANWAGVANYASTNGLGFDSYGVTSDYHPSNSCTYTPHQSWDAISAATGTDPIFTEVLGC